MKKYRVNTTLINRGALVSEGATIELTDAQAAALGENVTPIPTKGAATNPTPNTESKES